MRLSRDINPKRHPAVFNRAYIGIFESAYGINTAQKISLVYRELARFVLPGLTGWAQISYPHGDSEEGAIEKLQYDLYYIKNMSPLFDLQIIFESFKVILLGTGAR